MPSDIYERSIGRPWYGNGTWKEWALPVAEERASSGQMESVPWRSRLEPWAPGKRTRRSGAPRQFFGPAVEGDGRSFCRHE